MLGARGGFDVQCYQHHLLGSSEDRFVGLAFMGAFDLPLMRCPFRGIPGINGIRRRVSTMSFCNSVLQSPSGYRETHLV